MGYLLGSDNRHPVDNIWSVDQQAHLGMPEIYPDAVMALNTVHLVTFNFMLRQLEISLFRLPPTQHTHLMQSSINFNHTGQAFFIFIFFYKALSLNEVGFYKLKGTHG